MARTRYFTFAASRHGDAVGVDTTHPDKRAADIARPLSYKGRQQAADVERAIRAEGLTFDTVLASHALRAIETISVVTGFEQQRIIQVPALYMPDGDDGAIMDGQFGGLGYVPAAAYLDHARKAGPVLERYKKSSAAGILDALGIHSIYDVPDGAVIGIGGHAVCNSLAFAGLLECLPHAKEIIDAILNLDPSHPAVTFVVNGDTQGDVPLTFEVLYPAN